ncbi:tetratricopeptide repeat protein [Adhaeribacter soli]|uniref:Tetratricopeptide repeat protein n=1 Tax=Adhaeribacter soli TaxID=2607655 RepID=A0A5N1IQ32_9BACT|nr:tetratricopeptide repeat protein [Adhaeribacter soli]KAA9325951.1 tetratricopeptide repeat protein [Adhaeribacter soli]
MSARIAFLLVFLVLPFAVSGQPGFLLNKTYAERSIYLDSTYYSGKILRQDSLTLFPEIEKLARLALANSDEELFLETKLIRYTYYMVGRQPDHPLAEKKLLALREIADEKKIKQLQIRTRDKLAHYYYHIMHKHGPSFENYLAYYQLLKEMPDAALPEKQELIANIGSAYFNFGDNQNARKYFAEAQKLPPSYKKRFPINLQNTLGLIHRSEKRYPEAEKNFRKAYAMALAINDSTWMGIAAGNIGISYFAQGKYDEAIPLLEMDVRESFKASERDNGLHSLLILMKINLLKKNWAILAGQIQQAREVLPHTGNPYQHLKELYPILAQLSAKQGNMYLAYRYTDSASMVKDSLYKRRDAFLLARAENKAELEKYRADVDRLEAQKKFQGLWVNSLLVGVVLLLIIATLVISRQRLLYKQRQGKLQAEKATMEDELQQAAQKLQDFTQSIREKNKLLEQFAADLKQAQSHALATGVLVDQEALLQLQQATILTDDQWEDFRQTFETVHQGFLQRLKEKLPGLSPAETRFMVLSKLELTNKEMAAMLGVSPEAIRLTRHRLRKKLESRGEQSLEELIVSI